MRYKSLTDSANRLLPCFLIIMTGAICYSGTLQSSFQFDDFPSIVENRAIKDISDIPAIWRYNKTRFLVYLSFALNFHFHGLEPFGYHLVNLIIHILAALMVYRLVKLIFITPELKKSDLSEHIEPIALMTSLLFVSHPVQTQAVTYIVQRAASMAALFYIVSVSMYIKARINYDHGDNHVLFLCLSLVAALMAMFTKEISATLPFCILFVEYFFFSPSLRQLIRRLKYFWPMLLLVFVIPVTYVLTHKKTIASIGLAAETDTISRIDYLLTQFNVIKTYIGLLIFPLSQSVDYDFPISCRFFEMTTFSSFLLLLFIFMLTVALFKKSRMASFGIIWFYLTLMVESSFIPIRDVIFEHRLYLPSAGFFLTVSALICNRLKNRKKTLILLFTVIICIASLTTINRNVLWKHQLLLWNNVIKSNHYKSRAYLNRGVGYSDLSRTELALKDYAKVIQMDKNISYPYHNRGLIYLEKEEYESAITEFDKALDIQPNMSKTYACKGIVYLNLKKYLEAYKNWYAAVKLEPLNVFYVNGLGLVCKKKERYDLAVQYFTRAIELDNKFVQPHANRGDTKRILGKYKEAIADFNRAVELAPEQPETYYQRGLAYAGLSDYETAIDDFSIAISKNSEYFKAYNNRGVAYFRTGDNRSALIDLNEAIRLDPDLAKLYGNRGNIYRAMERNEDAEADFKKVRELEKKEKAPN